MKLVEGRTELWFNPASVHAIWVAEDLLVQWNATKWAVWALVACNQQPLYIAGPFDTKEQALTELAGLVDVIRFPASH